MNLKEEIYYEACIICKKRYPNTQFKYFGYDLKIHESCRRKTDQKTFIYIKKIYNIDCIKEKLHGIINFPYDIINLIDDYMNDYYKIDYVTGSPVITSYMITIRNGKS